MSNNKTSFSSSSGIGGGDPGRDYNPTSTDRDQQPTGDSGNYGGGVGDRTQGTGQFGGGDVQDLSMGDQYGNSGGYVPSSVNDEPGGKPTDKMDEKWLALNENAPALNNNFNTSWRLLAWFHTDK